ncbi:MAG: hypothetical protein WCX28_06985 [Bacteriovoracaceae bacterium]|nr:hypothetical protein [Bacteroidota bacterium]
MYSKYLQRIVIFTFVLSTVLFAQPRMGERGGREDVQIKRMKEKVGLSDDQTAKIKEILMKAHEEARKAFNIDDSDRKARREAMMKQMEKSDGEIIQLLTKEQKIKYEEFKKEREKEMKKKRRERE